MKCFILTGTSRGLGEALVRKLIHPDHLLFCIARTVNPSLTALSAEKNAHLAWIPYDLADTAGIAPLIEGIFSSVANYEIHGYYLINNAGILEPVKPAGRCDADSIEQNFRVNTVAPAILINAFIRHTQHRPTDKRILNLSSGAGRKPYYGWSSYCSAKAALDMFTRCVGLEQEHAAHPVKILSFAPGIIDTAMQQTIRESSPEDFLQRERFIEFKNSGKLKTADFVADKALELLFDDGVPGGSLIDINERKEGNK